MLEVARETSMLVHAWQREETHCEASRVGSTSKLGLMRVRCCIMGGAEADEVLPEKPYAGARTRTRYLRLRIEHCHEVDPYIDPIYKQLSVQFLQLF